MDVNCSILERPKEYGPIIADIDLENEKEVLGLYLSGHPLLKYADELEEFSNFDFTDKVIMNNDDKVRIG